MLQAYDLLKVLNYELKKRNFEQRAARTRRAVELNQERKIETKVGR